MKSKNLSQYVIALSVIGCSLILLAALTVAITGQRWGTHGRKLEIEFKDATGIKLHSSVRYAGAVAGSVKAIRYLTPAEREEPDKRDLAVRVTVQLERRVPALPSDIKATISSETMLGEKFVALSAGSPGIEPLPEGAIIQGQSLAGIESLIEDMKTTLAKANDFLTNLNGYFPELKTNVNSVLNSGTTLLSKATNVVDKAEAAMADARDLLSKANQTITDVRERATNLLAEATHTITNLNPAITNVQAITADLKVFLSLTNQFLSNLDDTMMKLTNALVGVQVAVEYANILIARLAEKPSRVIWQMRTNPVPSQAEIRQTLPKRKPKE